MDKVESLQELISIKESDVALKANTYIVPLPGNNIGFTRGELCFVKEVTLESFTLFRSMDGKRYTFTEEELKNFKLVGRP